MELLEYNCTRLSFDTFMLCAYTPLRPEVYIMHGTCRTMQHIICSDLLKLLLKQMYVIIEHH